MESWREQFYSNYLFHHGIKGQKWGVRRYQNYDGTLIKRNYKFLKAQIDVTNKLSNKINGIKQEPIDISEVIKRGMLTNIEANKCGKLALTVFNKASKKEPKITNDILESVNSTNAKMFGLNNRLKQPTSIAAKIGSDSKEKNISIEEASKIKDAIRYTVVSNDIDFVSNYNNIKNDLISKGYSETRCKNNFDLYSQGKVKHKSVQSVYMDKDGYEFEIQFHNPSSQAAKELKIPLYEEIRRNTTSDIRRKELEDEMVSLASYVKQPKNIKAIRTY